MGQESMIEATNRLAGANKRNDAIGETAVSAADAGRLPPKLRNLIKPLLILAALQVVVMIVGRILKGRYLGQEVGEDEVNAVGVAGAAQEKVTTQAFKGGYLRAVMGGVELDLRQAAIDTPPATIEATVVMGGAQIKVPQDWVVRIEAQAIMGGVEDMHGQGKPSEGMTPDLIITGKVMLGGLAVYC